MKAEKLQWCLAEAREKETLYTNNLQKVMDLVKTVLWNCRLTEEATYQAVVLTLNGGGDFWGIWMMEVLWKTVEVILNRRLGAAITQHNVFHGFRAGLGTETTSLEAKLFQQIMAMREEVLYAIFLYLYKA